MGHHRFERQCGLAQAKASKRLAAPGLAAATLSVLTLLAGTAQAEEPKGCDAFKWPLKQEAERLQAPDKVSLANGASVKFDAKAVDLKLVDFDTAALPMPPERGPKVKPSKAGFVTVDAPPAGGAYQVTISQAAWIDVVQSGHYVKPSAFTGALDCPGVRKSIRVTLTAVPLTVQISGTQENTVGLVIAPVPSP